MKKVRVEDQDTIVDTDTDLSRACDAVLEARESVSEAIKILHAAEATVIKEMIQMGKKSLKHGGNRFICAHQEEKNKLQIKSS